MKKISIFTGNRAEFGILFPIISELSTVYEIDLLLSGAHVLSPWNTKMAVVEQLEQCNIACNVIEIPLEESGDVYIKCMGIIYDGTTEYYAKNKDVSLAIVLGDRIESFAFALGTFYSQIPLIHLCGGDVVNVPNFDTNVRHSITKIANYHFVMSESSKETLLQMGEEEHRILNMGNPSFDYERMGFLPAKEELQKRFQIKDDDKVVVFTFHPASMKSAEQNFMEFKTSLDAVVESNTDKVIVTYPNNDPGYEQILEYLESMNANDKLCCVKSLGTYNYLSLMKNFKTIIVGNSSSGLLETPWYCVPVLNVGERQNERIRGCNVTDVAVDYEKIQTKLNITVECYDSLREDNKKMQQIFGNGQAAIKARQYIDLLFENTKEEQLYKKFIIR